MSDNERLPAFPRHLYGLLVGLTLGWGINWPVMKVVLTEMGPMHFRTLCLLFGAIGLFAIASTSGLKIRVPEGQWPRLIAIALFNVCGWNIFVVYGIPLLEWGTVMNLCDSPSWEANLRSSTAVHGGRSRAPRVGRGGPIRMIRKRR